jgi:NAD(P)-dependent dehydrogenase (short-subunit alcohol dehydrogenase family)
MAGWDASQLPVLSARTAVVTGSNSGIGWQVARQLAIHGARVVLACRDMTRAAHAATRIRQIGPPVEVDVQLLDLADMSAIRAFAERWHGPLHLLVNNAGVMAPPKRASTRDGFELQFGTNHLGHFVLTGLLLPALLRAVDPRVVTVSSAAHHSGRDDVIHANENGTYRPHQAYSNSKLANLLFALELQRRAAAHGVALASTAAHPGMCATGLYVDPEGIGANPFVRTLGPPFGKVFLQSAAAGATAPLYAATVADPGSYTGPQHIRETRGPIGPAKLSRLAQDTSLARRLWSVSEDLTGFRYPWPADVRVNGS